LKKVLPIDQYTLYGIGAGGNLIKLAKHDGKVISTIRVGGSFLNDFDIFDGQAEHIGDSSHKFIVFGGEIHSVILKYLNTKKIYC
jgi:hypothetical protein